MYDAETIERCVNLIKRYEGTSPKGAGHAYTCPAGYITVGWGRNLETNPLPVEICEQLLHLDIHSAATAAANLVGTYIWSTLSPGRRFALTDMCFQMGVAGLSKFEKMLAAVKRDDWDTVVVEAKDSKWYREYQHTERVQENVARLLTGEL